MKERVLERLFGSASRVKIIRLFFLNPDMFFDIKEISRRTRVALPSARREILLLKSVGFVTQKEEKIDDIIKLKNGKIKNIRKKIHGLRLNMSFPFFRSLKSLVVDTVPIDNERLIKMLSSVGRMKLAILSGIFIQSEDSRTDLFLVGDAIKKAVLQKVLKNIEAEIGKELVFAVLSTKEFLYRFGMYDKFVRDVLDYPHEKLINKLNV
ncbi:hypothetical protein L6251_00935 [Candidatus Parcubacteria bacterium]|nr:hypothetical protein [Patescibacteria group bacterium]MBU4477102.1 hypothetical protein [Patescibacteria group bacterium]MCG2698969.1 hypothetical protein [Candidatus Parcubacteria bacterium]